MKKITSIEQLKAAQQKIKLRRFELEATIEEDWVELKDSVRPKNITRQVLSAVLSKPAPGEANSLVKYLASFAAAGVAAKLLNKLKRKIVSLFT